MYLWVPLLVVVTLVGLWPTTASLLHTWHTHAAYGHGPLLFAFVAWWMARERRAFGSVSGRRSLPGFAILAATAALWLVLQLAELQAPASALVPVLATVTLWAAGGGRVAWRFVPLALLLYCAIPVWAAITPLLQRTTAVASAVLVQLAGVRTVTEGDLVHIPAGTFEVAAGCSGVNYLVAALTLAGCLSLWWRLRWRFVVVALAGAVLTALLTNWLRVAVIIYLGEATQMQHPWVAQDHYAFGWCLFAACFGAYLWLLASRLPPEAPSDAAVAPAVDVDGRPVAVGGALAIGVVLPAAAYALLAGWPQPAQGACASAGLAWAPVVEGADGMSCTTFQRDGATVRRTNAVFVPERLEHELPLDVEAWAGHDGWSPRVLDGPAVPGWSALEVSRGIETWRVLYRLQVGGVTVGTARQAKLELLRQRLAGLRPASSLEVRAAPCVSGCAVAATALTREAEG